jgi:hypothetical protein
MDYGDFKEMLKQQAPDNQLNKLDLPEISIVFDLLKLFRRIYQHELTPEPLKDFIYMEVRRALRKDLDIRGFLEGREEIF